MLHISRSCLTFSVLLLVPAILAAADPIGITGSFVNQDGAPLQIIAMTKSLEDQISELTLENKSNMAVISFQIEWVVAVPASCSAQSIEPVTSQAQADRVRIEKGASVSTKSYGLSTWQLVSTARNKRASLVVVQVRIAKVEFEDGSIWLAESSGPVFDQKSFQSHAKKCSDGKLVHGTESLSKSAACTTSPEGPQNLAPTTESDSVGGAMPNIVGCHWVCSDATRDPIYCINYLSSCLLKACPDKNSCAYQTCLVICP